MKELRASELSWLLRHKGKRIMRAPETALRLSAPIRKISKLVRELDVLVFDNCTSSTLDSQDSGNLEDDV
jgi:hypothetical protein